jgi:fumarate hydratase subunit alpha/L(+)-tartrate dehydratase alpha subunit
MLRIDRASSRTSPRNSIRALKILPPTSKQGFDALAARETATTAQKRARHDDSQHRRRRATDNLLCQDTGIPIYNVTIGRGVSSATATARR